jgi:aryl-alcohol dehydrogenase-like predicted oxidoreductase/RimJ/RimL family protein N-acetyltransferase
MVLIKNKIKIKILKPIDVTQNYLKWFKDHDIKKYVINTKYKNINQLKNYVQNNVKKKNCVFLGIFLKNKHIGNLKFEKINIKKKTSVMGILIGEKKYRNQGFSLNALLQGMTLLNKNYNIRYFWLGVNKKNIPAIHLYKKAGFRIIKEKKQDYMMLRDFRLLNLSRLSLGTAQLGMKYGINNRFGKIKINEAKNIVNYCEKLGIRSIDTAISYGNAEKILGKIGIKNFKITSKLPYIEYEKIKDIEKMVKSSIKNLKIRKLNCLLIHSSKNIEKNTFLILNKMKELKLKGLVSEIGISITKFHDIYKIVNNYNFDVIQLPYNIIDRRFESQKIMNLLKKKKIKIQIRSIFLQGLLFKKYPEIPSFLKVHSSDLLKFRDFLSKSKSTKLSYMLNFVYRNQFPKNYIFGIDGLKQLKDIAKIKVNNKLNFNGLKSSDENLINPSYWN